MQQYKSSKNTEIDHRLARQLEKNRGEIPFELDANKSGRITTKFPSEYSVLPFIYTTLIIPDGLEFEVSIVVTSRTKSEFTINIQNIGNLPAKGSILWMAC